MHDDEVYSIFSSLRSKSIWIVFRNYLNFNTKKSYIQYMHQTKNNSGYKPVWYELRVIFLMDSNIFIIISRTHFQRLRLTIVRFAIGSEESWRMTALKVADDAGFHKVSTFSFIQLVRFTRCSTCGGNHYFQNHTRTLYSHVEHFFKSPTLSQEWRWIVRAPFKNITSEKRPIRRNTQVTPPQHCVNDNGVKLNRNFLFNFCQARQFLWQNVDDFKSRQNAKLTAGKSEECASHKNPFLGNSKAALWKFPR